MIGEIRFDPSFKDADRTPMPLSRTIPLLLALLFLGTLTVAPPAGPHQKSRADRAMLDPTAQAPTDAELRDRREKLIANQHADDEALNLYERIERHVELTDGPNPRVLDDRTYRVVPTGGGTMKILLRDHSEAVSAEEYRHQLEAWRDVLETMSTPGNSKGDAARAKYEKRQRQRAEFVEAAQDAFLPKWIGRETCTGHPCDVFELNPNPAFHPRSMFQDALAHVAAKIWVDRDSEQLVRGLLFRGNSRKSISGQQSGNGTIRGGARYLAPDPLRIRFRRAQIPVSLFPTRNHRRHTVPAHRPTA
jgi:hypothetical protein